MRRREDDHLVQHAVLCAPGDASGSWLAQALRERGLDTRVVTTEELVYSTSLTHEVGAQGPSTRIRLVDGSIFGPDLRTLVNRVTVVPTDHLSRTAAVDRDYASQEIHALLLSLLHGLSGVVLGRPDPRGLSGAWWRPAEWMVEAGRAGMPVVGYRRAVSVPQEQTVEARLERVIVIGDSVVPTGGPVPDAVAAGCRTLGRRHRGGILGIDFRVVAGTWSCAGGTPLPDLRIGGDAAVAAVARALDLEAVAREMVSV